MGMQIKDGTGTGNLAKVDVDKRLAVVSTIETEAHFISEEKGQAYATVGTATPASATVVALHVKNTASDKNMTIARIAMQIIDPANGTALPNASNYFRIALDRTLTSGGATVTATNINASSGNAAEATITQSAPTLGGTADEFERWYPKAEADIFVVFFDDAVILGPTNTLEIAFVGDHTAGTIYASILFFLE